MIKTVLGTVSEKDLGITLSHEHICCYSEYAYQMMGSGYLDKDALAKAATEGLKRIKRTHGLTSFIDCTPVNIGRDLDLLRRVSEESEVNILCATGFYYTDEPVLYNTSADRLCRFIVGDAENVNAAVIKCAVEQPALTDFQEKVLRASARAHKHLGLPIVMHTNAKNQNALPALEILFSEGVSPEAITVGHLSDTRDLAFVKSIASLGCFIGLDRLYDNTSEEYIDRKLTSIRTLCNAGYEDRILLSHDAVFFSGFREDPQINESPRLPYVFEHILPSLPAELSHKLMVENPRRMLLT